MLWASDLHLGPDDGFSMNGELAADVHRPADATAIDMAQQMTAIGLSVPMPMAALQAEYDSAMAAAGWERQSERIFPQSTMSSYWKSESQREVDMNISSRGGHESYVKLTISSVRRFDVPGTPGSR